MLLQRLFNWIKYKSLPSSFLFKNRLFIERNTKHRKIISNFGTLFRNSKWGNYELSNVKTHFKLNYNKYLLFIFGTFILFFILFYYSKFYVSATLYNNVAFFFFMCIDAFDYYLSFCIWCVTASISIIINWIYSYFLSQLNLRNAPNKISYPTLLFKNYHNSLKLERFELKLTPFDLSCYYYNWISINPLDLNKMYSKLFNQPALKNYWEIYYDFYIVLFKLTYLFSLNTKLYSIEFLRYKLCNFNNFLTNTSVDILPIVLVNPLISSKYFAILLNYSLKNSNNSKRNFLSTKYSINLLKIKNNWNLSNISNNNLISNAYYLNYFDYKNLLALSSISELWNFSYLLKNQTLFSKWNRWLYKYSLLHRKFLKNSHKITITKKLFSSGFYDSNIFKKNTWNTAHKNLFNQSFLYHLNSIYYNDLYKPFFNNGYFSFNLNSNNSYLLKSKLSLFSDYETSFLWFIKRFYYNNSLRTNFNNSFYYLNSNGNNSNNSSLPNKKISHSISSFYYLNSFSLNSNFNDFFSFTPLNTFLNYKNNNVFFNNFQTKDLNLLFTDNNLWNLELLNFSYWITHSSSKYSNLFNFYLQTGFNHNNHRLTKEIIFYPDASLNLPLVFDKQLFTSIDNVFSNDYLLYMSFY